jgi:cytochrome c2
MPVFLKFMIYILASAASCTCFSAVGAESKAIAGSSTKKNSVLLSYKKKSFDLSHLSPEKSLWKTVRHLDANSNQVLTYSGYYLIDLLPQIKKSLGIEHISTLKIIAKDGYVTQLPWGKVQKVSPFLALEVSGYGARGIYNLSLKEYFKWQPGYLIYLKKSKSFKASAPYQVTQIEFEAIDSKKTLLNFVPNEFKTGAKVFLKTCNRCHSYKGVGGSKAPLISALTSRWKNNNEFKTFLRQPSKTLGRKISMSRYKGSEENLDSLILFLRSIELK